MSELRTRLSWEAYRREFPIFAHKIYFNTCSLGALCARVRAATEQFFDLWDGAGAAAWYGPWLDELETLRRRFADVIGARAEEVALFPSITTALTAVASCFDYTRRPKVVLSEMEFPTTVYQWSVKAPMGVMLTMVPSRGDHLSVDVDAYAQAIDDRTQLAVVSHVYYTSGAIQDIATIAELAHARGALAVVDAYQSVGQLPFDVHATGVDFLVTGGLKWLLGGPGIAYLYVRQDLIKTLKPRNIGWFAHRDQFAFDVRRFEYADDARRFEGGTPSLAATYAGRAGLDIVLELGVPQLRARQIELVDYLITATRAHALRPRVPRRGEDLAGIITIPRDDPRAVVSALARQDIIVDARPGVVRLSPYLYNTTDDCDRVVEALVELERVGIR
jgi:kynureninase